MSLTNNIQNLQNIIASLENKVISGDYDKGYNNGVEVGKQAEYDRFWDIYQQGGTRSSYAHAFSGSWTDEIFKPKYNIIPSGPASQMFINTEIQNLSACLENAGVILDTSMTTNFQYMFNYAKVTDVPNLDLTSATNINYMFNGCNSMKTAAVTFAENKVTNYTSVFSGCTDLEHFTATGVIDIPLSFASCGKLTEASVQSIIDHLKDLTGLESRTITFRATVGEKLTEEQKAAITAKNWTLAY